VIAVLAMIKPPWHFPVVLNLWGRQVPIHPVCDVVAYFVGFQIYLYLKRRSSGPAYSGEATAWILTACVFGALIGAKLLAWAESPGLYWSLRHDPAVWYGGKTIVGGLLGGWAGIELAKKAMGLAVSMGDLCVYPVIVGMCIGRVGCFLTGLSDETCGTPTRLPWGVDYGDGIPRHPAQIYEILFLMGLGLFLASRRADSATPGLRFRLFIAAYLTFRLLIDFLKPHEIVFGGLSGIQWGCVAGLAACAWSITKITKLKPLPENVHV
jgi:phosphatidylglycerol---prolipoprotein diacylglyceryl transferase